MISPHLTRAVAHRASRVLVALIATASVAAAHPQESGAPDEQIAKWMAMLAGMAVLPLLLTMITPFAKLVVVGSMLRQALGTQNIPPTSVITGLALILTIGIVRPVALDVWGAYENAKTQSPDAQQYEVFLRAARDPCRKFLESNSSPDNVALFRELQRVVQAKHDGRAPATDDLGQSTPVELSTDVNDAIELLTVFAPAFMLTELAEAFWIAALLFIPMLVIDLVVSNVLLAMGMQMMVPSTIALPIKVIVFVLAGGWKLLFQGLVLSYA